jgi:hypothetical protein
MTGRRASPSSMAGCHAQKRRLAPSCCVAEWLNRNPARSPPGRCLGCGEAEHAHDSLLPFGTEPTGHAWLHSRCWTAWHASRQADAVAALSYFVSEASVYRLLKEHDLIASPTYGRG